VNLLHLVGWYGVPVSALCVILLVVFLEGRSSAMDETAFGRRLRRSGRWRRINPVFFPMLIVPAFGVECWANPSRWTAYFTPIQWACGLVCLIAAPASVWMFAEVMPKLQRWGKLITLERVDRDTTGFHVRAAGGVFAALRQSNVKPMKNASLAAWFLVGHGDAVMAAGWRRVELVSPEVDEHALDPMGIEVLIAEHLPNWRVASFVDRPFPWWRGFLYWATKKPHRRPRRERGVVLEYTANAVPARDLKGLRNDRRAVRRAIAKAKASATASAASAETRIVV
jgi:hypothetical protein